MLWPLFMCGGQGGGGLCARIKGKQTLGRIFLWQLPFKQGSRHIFQHCSNQYFDVLLDKINPD